MKRLTAEEAALRSHWLAAGASTRLVGMALAALLTGTTTALLGAPLEAPVAAWDAAALVFILWVFAAIAPMNAAVTRSHATREDPGRTASGVIVVLAAVSSLASIGVLLVQAADAHGAAQDLLAGFAVLSIALSWVAVHLLFTLRYARLYYEGTPGGIDFNQELLPQYADFAYLAFSIGMTFQVSDTPIRQPAIRSAVLQHALLSYLLGAVVVASSINLVVNLGS